ncbi:NAD(P)H-hydrate dehydratase [Candidatus Woesebacteria bacterium]|nr:NAD(P)H-hydrate dehydratase [Candidatus Woesebacteria bacterium]
MNLSKIYTQRQDWVHKGNFGKLLVIAGSKNHPGSTIFNGMAALRSGCDLVTICSPQPSAEVAANFAADFIVHPLRGDFLSKLHVREIVELSKNHTALVAGGGLGRERPIYEAILEIIKRIEIPIVLDAEAVRALFKNLKVLKGKSVVLTPHAAELEAATGEKVSTEIEERKFLAKKFAQENSVVVVLKGHLDIVTDGMVTVFNSSGSPLMTKGGFGDTLAGICGAYLARGIKPFEAAQAATYLNGKAGEQAAKKFGEGVLASDIFDFIPRLIKQESKV